MNTAADIATIVAGGLAVYSAVARVLTRARRRAAYEFLNRTETQLVALIAGAFGACLAAILLGILQHSADLAAQSAELSAFNRAAAVVEAAGGTIMGRLGAILSLLAHLAARWGVT